MSIAQVLSTYQLSSDQVSDEALDVITGIQLVDGSLRLFVLEGPAQSRGMQSLLPAIARWALDDQEDEDLELQQEEPIRDKAQQGKPDKESAWLPRRVLYNPAIRCIVRDA